MKDSIAFSELLHSVGPKLVLSVNLPKKNPVDPSSYYHTFKSSKVNHRKLKARNKKDPETMPHNEWLKELQKQALKQLIYKGKRDLRFR